MEIIADKNCPEHKRYVLPLPDKNWHWTDKMSQDAKQFFVSEPIHLDPIPSEIIHMSAQGYEHLREFARAQAWDGVSNGN